jgi:enterochelin esterase-like enzyme
MCAWCVEVVAFGQYLISTVGKWCCTSARSARRVLAGSSGGASASPALSHTALAITSRHITSSSSPSLLRHAVAASALRNRVAERANGSRESMTGTNRMNGGTGSARRLRAASVYSFVGFDRHDRNFRSLL